jgi:hypothetical protein
LTSSTSSSRWKVYVQYSHTSNPLSTIRRIHSPCYYLMSSAHSALNAVDASERPRHSEQPQQEQTNRRYPKVILREASNIVTGPVPPDFLFLESPSPPQSYRIRFRHPAYPDSSNVLLSLHAWDGAHTACAIIANNRFDGYLSIARDGSSSIETEWDACLPTDSHGYYFHVPPPPGITMPHQPLRIPYETIPRPVAPSDLSSLYGRLVDELNLYGRCTNPITCSQEGVKRGDECPKCGHKREE